MSSLKLSDWLLSPHSFPGFDRYEVRAHEERGQQIHHTEWLHFKIPERYALVNAHDLVERA